MLSKSRILKLIKFLPSKVFVFLTQELQYPKVKLNRFKTGYINL